MPVLDQCASGLWLALGASSSRAVIFAPPE
jgi:hypothetical protein